MLHVILCSFTWISHQVKQLNLLSYNSGFSVLLLRCPTISVFLLTWMFCPITEILQFLLSDYPGFSVLFMRYPTISTVLLPWILCPNKIPLFLQCYYLRFSVLILRYPTISAVLLPWILFPHP